MSRNILAIIAILLCSTLAWAILGTTIMTRTWSAESGLETRVASTWGGEHQQAPPAAFGLKTVERQIEEREGNLVRTRKVEETVRTPLPVERSRIAAEINLEQRKKGLLWFPTYRVGVRGDYLLRGPSDSEKVLITVPFPAEGAIYDDLAVRVNGREVEFSTGGNAISATVEVPRGAPIRFELGYRSHGMRNWAYTFGEGVGQVRDFQLTMTTDFAAIDFPDETLSPTSKEKEGEGWRLHWVYRNLVTGSRIAMVMPEKLQPGPLAGRISYFAPVSLLFFFFLMFIITALRGIELHPMHYFFLAAAFFAFHLLLGYLADHISIHLAFGIAAAVSIFLVVSYLRLVVSARFAWVEAALSQLVYLVGFSYAFFLDGFTGLAVTIGAILTLFLVMQMTARLDWRTGTMREEPAAG
ncbi:MAG TPA: inner membrane CreD family protein [Thermoanaerobaculia bacterium]|nr:inner membrane CreD family protein [Thermoanaerobaculia bacterium]